MREQEKKHATGQEQVVRRLFMFDRSLHPDDSRGSDILHGSMSIQSLFKRILNEEGMLYN